MNIDSLLQKVNDLNNRCFPDAGLEHNLIHLKEEADEIIKQPDDLEEWADGLICYLGGFGKTNFTIYALQEACDKKITKNLNRNWVKRPDGTYKHVE